MVEDITLTLSPTDAQNLLVFLKRVNLNGEEAMAYVVLRNTIEQALVKTVTPKVQ